MVKTEPVDNSEKDDIIDVRGKYIQLPNGKMNGSLPSARVKMTKAERKRVSSQFVTDFPNAEKGGIYCYENGNYFYIIKVYGFGDYSFSLKVLIEGNEEAINSVRRSIKQWKD